VGLGAEGGKGLEERKAEGGLRRHTYVFTWIDGSWRAKQPDNDGHSCYMRVINVINLGERIGLHDTISSFYNCR